MFIKIKIKQILSSNFIKISNKNRLKLIHEKIICDYWCMSSFVSDAVPIQGGEWFDTTFKKAYNKICLIRS